MANLFKPLFLIHFSFVVAGQIYPPPPPLPPPPVEEEIFKVVEQMPRFPGCEDEKTNKEREDCAKQKMMEYIYGNLKYPALARENGVEGQCVAQFVVDKDGSIDDIKIIRDIGGGCAEAVGKLLESMNNLDLKWIPGKQRGLPVRVLYTLPVNFKLDEGSRYTLTDIVGGNSFTNNRYYLENPQYEISCEDVSGKKRCVTPEIKESIHHFYSFDLFSNKVALRISRNNSTQEFEEPGLIFKRLTKPLDNVQIELLDGSIIKSKLDSRYKYTRKILSVNVPFFDHYFILNEKDMESLSS